VKHTIRFRPGSPGSEKSPINGDSKTALLSRSCALVSLRRTSASQLRVLARILYNDEEISIRARYAGKNLFIVPFFLNSPDFWIADRLCGILIFIK